MPSVLIVLFERGRRPLSTVAEEIIGARLINRKLRRKFGPRGGGVRVIYLLSRPPGPIFPYTTGRKRTERQVFDHNLLSGISPSLASSPHPILKCFNAIRELALSWAVIVCLDKTFGIKTVRVDEALHRRCLLKVIYTQSLLLRPLQTS